LEHIHVAALELDAELAKKIGKKGSETDFAVYNCKESGKVICAYHPLKYPERVQPLLYSLSLCDLAYLRPEAIDRHAGEMMIAAAAFGKKTLVIADKVGREDVEPLLKAAGALDFEFFEGDAIALRERLLCEHGKRGAGGKARVVIDSCFPVKGVGTVALGVVQEGAVRVHQRLFLFHAGAEAEIKSIQVQDENVEQAAAGSRVGLNLKGIDSKYVERGEVASEEAIAPVRRVEAEVLLTPFFKGNFEAVQFFALSGLRFAPCRAAKIGEGRYEIALGSPLPLKEGEAAVLFFPDAMPRVIGRATVAKIIA